MVQKKFEQIDKNNSTQKFVRKLLEIWVGDPGTGKKPLPDPGYRGQKSTGSGYATLIMSIDEA